jgi:hypothetical protein
MNTRSILTLSAAITCLALAACDSSGDRDGLTNGETSSPIAQDPTDMGGGDHQHNQSPNASDPAAAQQPTDAQEKRAEQAVVGTPEVGARLHSCGKISYASLGTFLTSRGVNMRNNAANSAGALYTSGGAALGVPNYSGRVPEAPFYSTSGMAKQMDIFAIAAGEIIAPTWTAPACPNVKLFNGDDFTKEGISCLIGKPAKDEHVALANQAVKQAQTPAAGKQIAVSALLAASHTCE